MVPIGGTGADLVEAFGEAHRRELRLGTGVCDESSQPATTRTRALPYAGRPNWALLAANSS